MINIKHISSMCLAAAIAYFSYALILFVDEVANVRVELPQLLTQIEALEKKADLDTWSALAAETDVQLPLLVTEIERSRLLAESLNAQIPAILTQVKLINTRTVPSLLKEVAAVRTDTVPALLLESATLRKSTVPAVLAEVAAVRKMVPETLQQAEVLVEKAQLTGKLAAEGAVKGTVEGVIKTPFSLIKDAGKVLIGR